MESKIPFFSIILPIYGVEPYLERCIKSIIDQNFASYEIILVDDGSKDRCPEICDRYVEENSKIKVIHKKNEGLGMARNTGLKNACGKYVFFVDSDDYLLPNVLKDTHDFLKLNNTDIVFIGSLFNGAEKVKESD